MSTERPSVCAVAPPDQPTVDRSDRSLRGLVGLLIAAGLSGCGTRMSGLAIPWFVLVSTGSLTATGLIAAAEMVPYVIAQTTAGPLVDRLDARRASFLTDGFAALGVVAIPILSGLELLPIGVLAGLVILVGAARGTGEVARGVLVPEVTERAGAPLERGAGLEDGVGRIASLLGLPLAGVLIALWSAPTVLLIDAGTFLVSGCLVAILLPARARTDRATASPESGSYRRQLAEGFAFLRADRLLLAIGAMVFAGNLLDQAMGSVLNPAWAREVTGSPTAVGLFGGAFGIGAVIGNAVLTWLAPRLPRRWTFAVCYLLTGAPRFLALALLSATSPALVIFLVSGLGAGALNPILGGTLYERVPAALRARVLGPFGAIAQAGLPLGSLLGGLSAGHLGLRPSLALAGGIYLLVTLAPFVFPIWRTMQRQPASNV